MLSQRPSPDAGDSVLLEGGVGTNYGYLLDELLGYEKTVEWISVVAREVGQFLGVLHRDGKKRRLQVGQRLVHPLPIRHRQRQPCHAQLNGDLPHRRRTYEKLVGSAIAA